MMAKRLSKFTPEVQAQVLRALALGQTVKGMCAKKGFPVSPALIFGLVHDDPEFAAKYRKARFDGLNVLVDDLLFIADDATPGEDNAAVQRAKLRCENRRWLLAKLLPEFADRTRVDMSVSVEHREASEVELVSRLFSALCRVEERLGTPGQLAEQLPRLAALAPPVIDAEVVEVVEKEISDEDLA